MTAAAGTEVGLYVDLVARVAVGDVIETQTGRRYGVVRVRVQERGKHAGRRQHLRAIVLNPTDEPALRARANGDGIDFEPGRIHRIRWYRRPGGGVKPRGRR